jgi:hypothetical protein
LGLRSQYEDDSEYLNFLALFTSCKSEKKIAAVPLGLTNIEMQKKLQLMYLSNYSFPKKDVIETLTSNKFLDLYRDRILENLNPKNYHQNLTQKGNYINKLYQNDNAEKTASNKSEKTQPVKKNNNDNEVD